jgi:hypothetical protein
VKSVLQSVSTYTMRCFHFSKKLCKQLSSILSRFSWGAANGNARCTGYDGTRSVEVRVMGGWASTISKSLIKPCWPNRGGD